VTPAQQTISAPALLEAPSVAAPAPSRAPSQLWRTLVFPVKLLWGMAFCQSVLGSIFVVGWSYRLAQRSVLKYWWSRRPLSQARLAFDDFLAGSEQTRVHRRWPNWFAEQNFREAIRPQPHLSRLRRAFSFGRAPCHSVWLNFWIGLRAITNTWALTLPACLFWWFGWYDGWNNSFNKGYEQAPAGPLISIFGIFLFIAAMFYVPLAQARQCATGEWRSFFQFGLVWSVVRLRWISSVCLALLYSLFALLLHVLQIAPMFLPQGNPGLEHLTDAQVLKRLDGYFFWCALLVLPAYVILRLAAARIYASGILALVQTGKINAAKLSGPEREPLQRLALLEMSPQRERNFLLRWLEWAGTRFGRMASAIALALIWFSFVAQIYIAEFFQYHRGVGWINQPLVQLPWFHYLPTRLKNPWSELFSALLVWLVAVLIWSVRRAVRNPSRAFKRNKAW